MAKDEAYVGGGSTAGPGHAELGGGADRRVSLGDAELARRLRTGTPGGDGAGGEGRVVLDVRTVLPDQEGGLVEAVGRTLEPMSPS